MIFCTACGSASPADAKFCAKCGKPIVSLENPPLSGRAEPPALPAEELGRRPGKTASIALIVANLILFFLLEIGLIFVLPVFAAMFVDFGARLPAPTQFFIDYRRWVAQGLLAGGLLLFALIRSHPRDAQNWVLLATALAQFFLLLFFVLSLFLPIFQLGAVAGKV